MDHTGFLTGNLTLDLAILAWFAAQMCIRDRVNWLQCGNKSNKQLLLMSFLLT